MGIFLDEAPNKSYKGKFLDDSSIDVALVDGKPSPLKRISPYGGKQGLKNLAFGGMVGYGSVPGSEDILPTVGQTVGGMIPGVNSFGGAVVGAMVGKAGEKSIKDLRSGKPTLGNPVMEYPKDLIKEGAGTAATEGFFRGADKVIPKVANRMMLSVLKPARNVIKRSPNFGLEALDAGIVGTKAGMLNKAEDVIRSGEDALQSAIKGNSGKVDAVKIAQDLESIKSPFFNVGDDASVKAIEEVQNNLISKGSLSLEEANTLKRDLYKVIKENAFGKGIGDIAAKTSARKQAAHGLKSGIESVIPEAKNINKKIGTGVKVREALENALANDQKKVLLPKLAGMGAGGLALSGHPLGGAGVWLGDAVFDALRSAPIVTGAAKNLMQLRRFGIPTRLITSEVSRKIFGNN